MCWADSGIAELLCAVTSIGRSVSALEEVVSTTSVLATVVTVVFASLTSSTDSVLVKSAYHKRD